MPKIVDHDQYRKELLSKCFDLFAQKGYASITMRQIAEGLGVSTGTLYHYFPSKKALFWQLVDELNERDMASISASIDKSQPLEQKIADLFDFHAKNEDYFFKQILVACDFYQQQERAEVIANESLKRTIELNRQFNAEVLGIQDSKLGDLTTCVLLGALLMRLFGGDVISYAEQAQLLGQMLRTNLQEDSENPQPKIDKKQEEI